MQNSRQVEIANLTRGTVLGSEIHIANTALSRLVGLLGHSGLAPGDGLLIEPSSGVHTFGMRFPIDVVALDRDYCVRGVWEGLGPFRIAARRFENPQGAGVAGGRDSGKPNPGQRSAGAAASGRPVDSKSGTHAPALLTSCVGLLRKPDRKVT